MLLTCDMRCHGKRPTEIIVKLKEGRWSLYICNICIYLYIYIRPTVKAHLRYHICQRLNYYWILRGKYDWRKISSTVFTLPSSWWKILLIRGYWDNNLRGKHLVCSFFLFFCYMKRKTTTEQRNFRSKYYIQKFHVPCLNIFENDFLVFHQTQSISHIFFLFFAFFLYFFLSEATGIDRPRPLSLTLYST